MVGPVCRRQLCRRSFRVDGVIVIHLVRVFSIKGRRGTKRAHVHKTPKTKVQPSSLPSRENIWEGNHACAHAVFQYADRCAICSLDFTLYLPSKVGPSICLSTILLLAPSSNHTNCAWSHSGSVVPRPVSSPSDRASASELPARRRNAPAATGRMGCLIDGRLPFSLLVAVVDASPAPAPAPAPVEPTAPAAVGAVEAARLD